MKILNTSVSVDYIVGVIALIITGALMYTSTISSDIGITIFIGILVSLGAYRSPSPKQK